MTTGNYKGLDDALADLRKAELPKYNLTFWQRYFQLPIIWWFWVQLPENERKTWHNVKKGLETHICEFEEVGGEKWMHGNCYTTFHNCKHEGCNMVQPKLHDL